MIGYLDTKFVVYVITYKIFQSSRPNSVSYVVVDLEYKIIKKGHKDDLVELQLR